MRYDIDAVIELGKKQQQSEFIFFWSHRRKEQVSKTSFSQWYEAGFKHDGIYYQTAEHWMMAEKARLFQDPIMLEKILIAESPKEAKELGRMVSGFDQTLWEKERYEIVKKGNKLKFEQNKDLKDLLISTGDAIIVEASPFDKIWGIGMDENHKDVRNPEKWQGLNLLGFALMEIRDMLLSSS